MKINPGFNELKSDIKVYRNVWLLLYKKGLPQSDCAFENFVKSEQSFTGREQDRTKEILFCSSDVNIIRDIHTEYNITTVPVLLHFENGDFKNNVKGCSTQEQFNAIFENSVFVDRGTKDAVNKKNVLVYTTPVCTWCNAVKRHLQENRIQFRELDVSSDTKAMEEMMRKSRQQGVPQIDINGEIVVGFDRERIDKLLGIN
jgi:glutaredoxin-like YruB-family protein